MRHGDKVNNLGRTKAHRHALMANLAIALIEHKRINTTLAKAKALRQYVEPLVTKSKENTTHSRRVVFSYLQNKEAIKELFGAVATKVGDRPGGYVRVIKLGFRRGDGAEMAMIELVDFNETYNLKGDKAETKKKTRRGNKKPTESKVPVKAAPVAPVAEPVVEEEETVVDEPVAVMEEQVAAPEAPAVEEAVAEVTETETTEEAAEETAAPETTTEEEENKEA